MSNKQRRYDIERAINTMIYVSEEGSANINTAISEARLSLIDSIMTYPNYNFPYELFDSHKNDNGSSDKYISGAKYCLENEKNMVQLQIDEEKRNAVTIEPEKKQPEAQSSAPSSDLTTSLSDPGGSLFRNTSELIKKVFESVQNN